MTPEEGAASGRLGPLQATSAGHRANIYSINDQPRRLRVGVDSRYRNQDDLRPPNAFVRQTAIDHPEACLLRSSINLIKGMNSAMTMKPTAPPMKTINNGSSKDIIAATAESTSSS